MMHAYNELYLSDAKENLAQCFDYMIRDCRMEADFAMSCFLQCRLSEEFAGGNPAVVSGMSGAELAMQVIWNADPEREMPEPTYFEEKSPEYWAGWALAEYQWYSGRSFRNITECVRLSEVISMYVPYHEMDQERFCEYMEERCSAGTAECRLKRLREYRGISQAHLAKLSGVNLRSIQMYEQRVNDIDKAQAATLYRIARVIGCRMEDLLENPSK